MYNDSLRKAMDERLSRRQGVPQSTLDGLRAYVVDGREPGGFLMACLENRLVEALGAADEHNEAAIGAICLCLHNDLPAQCRGSAKAVERWLDWHADERAKLAAEGVV